MAIFYFLLASVKAYNIYSFGLDDLEISILKSSIIQMPAINCHHIIAGSKDLNLLSPNSIDLLIVSSLYGLELQALEIYSETNHIPTLFLRQGFSKRFAFYSDPPAKCFASSIKLITNFLSLSRPAIVYTYSIVNQEILQETRSILTSELGHISIVENSTSPEISITLNKVLKKAGVMNYIFIPNGNSCKDLIKGFEDSHLNIKGNIAIFLADCIYEANKNGYIILTSELSEVVKSEKEYKTLKILKFLSVFSKSGLTNLEISKKLQNVYPNSCKFSIVNIQNDQKQVVGSISDDSVNINQTLVYIGEILDLSNYTFPRIVVSANTGSFNPSGAPRVYSNVGYQEGSAFAIEKINRDHKLFSNHKLLFYGEVDCGVSIFNYSYSKDCFQHHRPEMGVAYITTYSSVTYAVLQQLHSLNLSLPFIGGIGGSVLLSNKSASPYFVRTVSASSHYSIPWANLIKLYNWNKIVVHYTNDSFGITSFNRLNNSKKTYDFEFINEEKYRMVNPLLTNESIHLYYDHMKNSLSLGCNIIFLMMGDPTTYFWLEGFYDMGARRGDQTFILFIISGITNFAAVGANLKKRKELMHGTLVIYNAAWVGEYGAQVKNEYLKYRKESWGRSYYIDAVYCAAETVNFLMNQGKPYEDIDVFMQSLRNIRFLGTTGTISFDSNSNDRNIYYFNVFNFYEDAAGVWHSEAVGLISPMGTVYYTVLQETIWSNGEVPSAMKKNYLNCPFRKDQIRNSSSGVKIKIGVSVTLLVISTALTIYSLHKLKFRKLRMMETKSYIVFEDYMTFGFIFVEALQMISIGPSFSSFNRFLSNVSEILSLNISNVTSFKDTTFWIIFLMMIVSSYIWIILLVLSFFRVFRYCPVFYRNIEALKTYSIPIMSNYLFLPTIVCLVSILMCDKAISDEYEDSYLNYDCNTFCWRDYHIIYSVLACFQIIIYIPLAILYRTLWQEDNKHLNIRTSSIYLIIKNVIVVVLVILGKILKEDFKLVHGLIFLTVNFILIVLVVVINKPYNYDRANLWCKVMIVCIIWNTVVCLIGNFLISNYLAPVVLQIIGWLVIGITGGCFQRRLSENLLVSIKGRSVAELFKFAFGIQSFRKSVYVLDEEEVNNLCEEGSRFN